jgi:hypothetical protein
MSLLLPVAPPIRSQIFPFHFPTLGCNANTLRKTNSKSRHSSVGIALGYGLDDRSSGVRFPTGAANFSLHHRAQNGSGAHPASYPMDNRGSFPGGGVKRTGREADNSPPSAEVKECLELYLLSPGTPSWRGAQLQHRHNFTFTFL